MTVTAPSRPPNHDEPRHPIQVVVRRTGLTADALRAWERRYGAVAPARSGSQQRLYSDADIERLRLLRLLTQSGRRIGQVAGLGLDELEELAGSDLAAAPETPVPAGPPSEATAFLQESLTAVARLEAAALEQVLRRATLVLGASRLLDELVLPLLRRIGELWQSGELSPAHEHLATVEVRSLLSGFIARHAPQVGAPDLVVATPPHESHELGALAASVAAALEGWRTTYLGPDVPMSDLAAAARQRAARAVALSIVTVDGEEVVRHVAELASWLPGDCLILVGGAGAVERRSALESAGAIVLDNFAALRDELRRVREGRAARSD